MKAPFTSFGGKSGMADMTDRLSIVPVTDAASRVLLADEAADTLRLLTTIESRAREALL